MHTFPTLAIPTMPIFKLLETLPIRESFSLYADSASPLGGGWSPFLTAVLENEATLFNHNILN